MQIYLFTSVKGFFLDLTQTDLERKCLLLLTVVFSCLRTNTHTRTHTHTYTHTGVSSQYQSLMFRVLSAILHMGNIKILPSAKGADSCYIEVRTAASTSRRVVAPATARVLNGVSTHVRWLRACGSRAQRFRAFCGSLDANFLSYCCSSFKCDGFPRLYTCTHLSSFATV